MIKARRVLISFALGLGLALALLGLLDGWPAPTRAVRAAAAQSGPVWISETVDSAGDVGGHTSLALEPTAPYTPHISYYDDTNDALKHAYWDASGWHSETVDRTGNVGLYTSLTLEPNPPYTPHISYYDSTKHALKYAYWDASASEWISETVDSVEDVGKHTSLALAPTAPYTPHISYHDQGDGTLKHAYRDGSDWISRKVDSTGNVVGEYTSLTLEPTAPYTPHISYYKFTNNDLKHAYWDASASEWISETVDSAGVVGKHTSLALEPTAPYTPHISYDDDTNDALKHAYWDASASEWISETVDRTGHVGEHTSLALAPTPPYTPHISYYDNTNNDLKHAYWDASASEWISETVDSAGDVGRHTSLALEPTAPYTPHISYYDDTNYDLKHATWGAAQQPPEPVGGITLPGAGVQAVVSFVVVGLALFGAAWYARRRAW